MNACMLAGGPLYGPARRRLNPLAHITNPYGLVATLPGNVTLWIHLFSSDRAAICHLPMGNPYMFVSSNQKMKPPASITLPHQRMHFLPARRGIAMYARFSSWRAE